jgi:hypothetical protein
MMENTVIKVRDQEHGRKVVNWFKSQGVDTSYVDADHIFSSESRGDALFYYGVINGQFENWGKGYVKTRRVRIIELLEEAVNEPELNVIL